MDVTSISIFRQTKVISGTYTLIVDICDSVRHPVVVDNSTTLNASSLIASLLRSSGVYSTRRVLRDCSPPMKGCDPLFELEFEGHSMIDSIDCVTFPRASKLVKSPWIFSIKHSDEQSSSRSIAKDVVTSFSVDARVC